MARFGAMLDACVLAPMPLVDTLLRMAEQGLFHPFWSRVILEEVQRTLDRFGHPVFHIQHRIAVMEEHFPEAMVATVPGLSFSSGLPDPNDEHVLEAAVRSGAQAIVTFNLKHFPVDVCSQYDIDVMSPDTFLASQFDLSPAQTCQLLVQQAQELRNPAVPLSTLIDALRRDAPEFAQRVERELR